MNLEIFDVEHGACSLITTEEGKQIMIDCGHNASTGWMPGDYLVDRGITRIEALIVTNYDEDHVSGLPNLKDNVSVGWLYRNKSVTAAAIRNLKSDSGMGPGIERLIYEIENVFTGPSGGHDLESLKLVRFMNDYPTDFEDENNLSFVTFVKYQSHSILFPDDLQTAGWQKLLEKRSFRDEITGVSVLLAAHHGREDGVCEDVFGEHNCNPFYIVISDKSKGYQSQETTDYYRRVSRGGPFRGENRHVLTTRRDGNITFNFRSDGWGPI